MKLIKLFIPLLLITALLSAGTVFAQEGEGGGYVWPENPTETYSLVTATTVAEKSQCGATLKAIDETLRERSNGAVGLDLFWVGTLGSSVEVGEATASGTVDIGLVTAAVISNYTPSIEVMSLPFIIRDRDHVRAIIDTCFDDVTAGIPDTLGTPLGLWEYGFCHLFTRSKEVKTLDDIKGLTIRVKEGKLLADIFEALGAIPTNVALSELVTALQQGVVDGAELPLITFTDQQQYNFCKYMYGFGYNYSSGCPILTSGAYERYPQEVIDLVKEVFDEYKYYSLEVGAEMDEEFLKVCEDAGMVFNYPDEAEIAKFKEVVQPVVDQYSEKIGKDLVDKVANAQ